MKLRSAILAIGAGLLAQSAFAESGPVNFHLEPGVTLPLPSSGYQGVGFNMAGKLDFPVAGPLAIQAQGFSATLPNQVRLSNLFGAGLGVRVRLLDDHKGYKFHTRGDTKAGNWFGNLYFDGSLLVTGTSALNRLGVDVGVGTELSIIDGFQVGPILKFTNADTLSLVTLGLSLSFGGDPLQEAPGDADHDGIADEQDKCPTQAEDKDGYKDDDGCPDPDNDGDNIVDDRDKCPNNAEDFDGYQDDDGCPDPDNDSDGVPDVSDKCPNQAGPAGNQGCPEAPKDSDNDGVADAVDKCPDQPEDKDGYQDEDGCPDPDNDNDGILDAQDKCPLEPETVNGIDDGDGCPEPDAQAWVNSGNMIVTKVPVVFEKEQATLSSDAQAALIHVADLMKKLPAIKKVRVDGFATGVKGNVKLSETRAKAVADYLVSKGVEKARIEAKGNGERPPSAQGGTTSEGAVDIVIVDPASGIKAG